MYNRQLHPTEIGKIEKLAREFMAECGCSEVEARERLIVQAAQNVDLLYDLKIGETDKQAASFLKENSFTFTDEYGKKVTAFEANSLSRANGAIYSELLLKPENREALRTMAASVVNNIDYHNLDQGVKAYLTEKLGSAAAAAKWLADNPEAVPGLLQKMGNALVGAGANLDDWLAENGEAAAEYTKANAVRCKELGTACVVPSDGMLSVMSVLYGEGRSGEDKTTA